LYRCDNYLNPRIDYCAGLGVDDTEILNGDISVFPNPANNEITIVFPDNISKGKIEIFDQLGRSVKVLPVTETTQILDIQSFSTGNYFMKMTIDENTIVYKRFVKM
jgi:hypothetical protein